MNNMPQMPAGMPGMVQAQMPNMPMPGMQPQAQMPQPNMPMPGVPNMDPNQQMQPQAQMPMPGMPQPQAQMPMPGIPQPQAQMPMPGMQSNTTMPGMPMPGVPNMQMPGMQPTGYAQPNVQAPMMAPNADAGTSQNQMINNQVNNPNGHPVFVCKIVWALVAYSKGGKEYFTGLGEFDNGQKYKFTSFRTGSIEQARAMGAVGENKQALTGKRVALFGKEFKVNSYTSKNELLFDSMVYIDNEEMANWSAQMNNMYPATGNK